jgi:putative transposase
VRGRERHPAVDTNGVLLLPYVTGAEVQDRDAADALLADLEREQPTLLHAWADRGDAGEPVDRVHEHLGVTPEIVRRTGTGFTVHAKRWIVDRTIAWIGRGRRMARDVEACAETTAARMYPAMIRPMLRRPCPPPGREADAAI